MERDGRGDAQLHRFRAAGRRPILRRYDDDGCHHERPRPCEHDGALHLSCQGRQGRFGTVLYVILKSHEKNDSKVTFNTMRQLCMLTAMHICIALFFVYPAAAQKFENLAQTPPMGWNSWNKFACDGINETGVREDADAMVSTGMRDAGYQYIVIDDCWQVSRDSAGNIVADAVKFPHGIKALADYIHSKGLKFGIYTCAGRNTCAGRPASQGYEWQDARQYAAWGVDYLKEDWCNTGTENAQSAYTLMRDALYKAGRPIVFSLCEWGTNKPWHWAAGVGHLWRTCGDIGNNWSYMEADNGTAYGGSVIANLDLQRGLEQYAGPGHWNDPDMLEVGN